MSEDRTYQRGAYGQLHEAADFTEALRLILAMRAAAQALRAVLEAAP